MKLEKGMKLYHGSYTIVKVPDLSACKPSKDFGLGFYLTTDMNQAKRFVKTAVQKAIKNGVTVENANTGFVSVYELSDPSGIRIFEFADADREWLHCVAAHRSNRLFRDEIEKWSGFDIIAGKIANDNTNLVITAYMNGLYGAVGTDRADNTAIGLLLPDKLTDQICFKTDKSLRKIKHVNAIECRF